MIVLSVTAVLTAWSGFESSKWGGEMSIAFSQASTARIESARFDAQADAERAFDLNVFGVYVQAVADETSACRSSSRPGSPITSRWRSTLGRPWTR